MGYSTSNPPVLTTTAIAGVGNLWKLTGTDANADVNTAGYITNGGFLGMKVNDQVEYVKTDSSPPLVYRHNVVSVNATTGAVDLDNGVQIGGVGNSD